MCTCTICAINGYWVLGRARGVDLNGRDFTRGEGVFSALAASSTRLLSKVAVCEVSNPLCTRPFDALIYCSSFVYFLNLCSHQDQPGGKWQTRDGTTCPQAAAQAQIHRLRRFGSLSPDCGLVDCSTDRARLLILVFRSLRESSVFLRQGIRCCRLRRLWRRRKSPPRRRSQLLTVSLTHYMPLTVRNRSLRRPRRRLTGSTR